MMSGVPLETCCAFNKLWNNKFYYKLHLVGISTVQDKTEICFAHIFIIFLDKNSLKTFYEILANNSLFTGSLSIR